MLLGALSHHLRNLIILRPLGWRNHIKTTGRGLRIPEKERDVQSATTIETQMT